MSDAFNDDVLEKLDTLIRLNAVSQRLSALLLIRGRKQREQMAILSIAGFQVREIADLVGTTPNTVSVELSKLRKEGKLHLVVRREEKNGGET